MAYVSTQSNPFLQGGWTKPSQSGDVVFSGPFSFNRTPTQSSFGTLSQASGKPRQSRPRSSIGCAVIKFTPVSTADSRYVNCAIIGPQNSIIYTVSSENPSLTVIRDSERHPVALVEWSSTPVVEIRGDKGKKSLDQWLVPDVNNGNTRLMIWKGVRYYWTANNHIIELYAQGHNSYPFATVRAAGSMFEVEFSVEALKAGVMEPSIVALIIIQWGNGFFA